MYQCREDHPHNHLHVSVRNLFSFQNPTFFVDENSSDEISTNASLTDLNIHRVQDRRKHARGHIFCGINI